MTVPGFTLTASGGSGERIVALSGASLPTTRRFSSAQRRTAVVPAIRPSGPITAIAPKAVHPDILARRHQP